MSKRSRRHPLSRRLPPTRLRAMALSVTSSQLRHVHAGPVHSARRELQADVVVVDLALVVVGVRVAEHEVVGPGAARRPDGTRYAGQGALVEAGAGRRLARLVVVPDAGGGRVEGGAIALVAAVKRGPRPGFVKKYG